MGIAMGIEWGERPWLIQNMHLGAYPKTQYA